MPLTELDTKPVFYYFNSEWIAGASPEMVTTDSILKMEVKNDEYGNRAVFISIPPHSFEQLKHELKEADKGVFINYDPICEFPSGNGGGSKNGWRTISKSQTDIKDAKRW